MQGVTISTASNIDMQVESISAATRNIDVKDVFLSTLSSMDVQCYTFPSPEVQGVPLSITRSIDVHVVFLFTTISMHDSTCRVVNFHHHKYRRADRVYSFPLSTTSSKQKVSTYGKERPQKAKRRKQ